MLLYLCTVLTIIKMTLFVIGRKKTVKNSRQWFWSSCSGDLTA